MAKVELVIEYKISWWVLNLYVPLLTATYFLCSLVNEDVEPNWDKVNKTIRCGTKFYINGRRV